MTQVIFDNPQHANGGCIFDVEILVEDSNVTFPCIFDNPQHANGGCIFDPELQQRGGDGDIIDGIRPATVTRREKQLREEDEIILMAAVAFIEMIH